MMNFFNIYYTLPQWLSFLSIIGLIISIVERKAFLRYAGLTLSILVGTFAIYVISAQQLLPGAEANQKIIAERLLQNPKLQGIEPAQLIPAYWMFIIGMILSVVVLLFKKIKRKQLQLILYFIALIELIGFFFVSEAINKL